MIQFRHHHPQQVRCCRFVTTTATSHTSSSNTSLITMLQMIALLVLISHTTIAFAYTASTSSNSFTSHITTKINYIPSFNRISHIGTNHFHSIRLPLLYSSSTQNQQQHPSPSKQLVDDDYLNALQNFAATATSTNTDDNDEGISSSSLSSLSSSSTSSTTTSSNNNRSWRDDGFIYGMNDSGLQRPNGKQVLLVVDGDTTETKPYQVALVVATFINHFYYLISSINELYQNNNYNTILTTIQIVTFTILSWITADFGSGVLHWSVDNYGNGRSPIFGTMIAAFQGHHTAPWTITQRSFYNNIYKLCVPFGIIPITIINYISGPIVTYFFTIFCIFEILSQEFHKWSHSMKSETPYIGNILQTFNLSIGRKQHIQHHTIPFHTNYCIISGICNRILDQYGFFRRLEHFIYKINGIESNVWKLDPNIRHRTLNGNYTLP